MGKEFLENFELARTLCERASDSIGIDMKKLMAEDGEKLEQTCYTQPAILTVSVIAQQLFESEAGIKPLFAIGHSLGEFSALVAAGAISFEDAVSLVHNRGLWMQQACEGKDAGMMAVLGLSDEEVQSVCEAARQDGKKVWPANYNSDGQIVLAGLKEDLKSIEGELKAAGAKRALLLAMSVASHCELLEDARVRLLELLKQKVKGPFAFEIISNATAQKYSDAPSAHELLAKQLISPVLYKQSIQAFAPEVELFIEFGHGGVLAGLNKRITNVATKTVSDPASLAQILETIKED